MKTDMSKRQLEALRVLAWLAATGTDVPSVREIAPLTGQTADGAAYTLRSLVVRELVSAGEHEGGRYGYKLTEAGVIEAGVIEARAANGKRETDAERKES